MVNTVIFTYLGIIIVMVIAAFILGRRSSKSQTNHETNTSDFIDIGSDDAHDHVASSGPSHGDSGF